MAYSKARSDFLSPLERRLLALLVASRKRMSTLDLAAAAYPEPGWRPNNARQTVLGGVRSAQNKLIANKAEQRVVVSPRRGPHPVTFYIERVK